jgi:cytochrome P450
VASTVPGGAVPGPGLSRPDIPAGEPVPGERSVGARFVLSRLVPRPPVPLPPSPPERSPLGSLPGFSRDPLGTLSEARRTCGDVAYLHMGNPRRHVPTYLVSHPAGIEQVLATHQQRYAKSFTALPARSIFGNGLLTSDGPSWVEQRRIVRPLFRPERVEALGEITVQTCDELSERWAALAGTATVVDVSAEMARVSLTILLRSIFGLRLAEEDVATVGRAFEVLSLESWRRTASLPWWLFPRLAGALPPARGRRFRAAVASLDHVVDTLVAAGAPDERSLLARLLDSRDAAGRPLSRQLIRDEIATFLIAGHETTAASLTWAWHLLATNPEPAERLLAATGGADPAPGLRYATAVVQEALRLYPPAWSIVRDSVAEDEVGGFRIPPGSVVVTCPYVTHRDPVLWADPDAFVPERFLDDGQARHPYAYFPFGAGKRHCVGDRMAMRQSSTLVATLAGRFRLTAVDGAAEPPPVPVPAVTLRPDRPIRLRLAAR